MTTKEKEAVKDHINKTAGWNEISKGYQAIKTLFEKREWCLSMCSEPKLYLDIAKWLRQIGLEIEIRSHDVKLDDDAIIKYYEKVIGLKVTPKEPEQSYYERYILSKKND